MNEDISNLTDRVAALEKLLFQHKHTGIDQTQSIPDLQNAVPNSRTITAGAGLTGGGNLSSNVALALDSPVSVGNGGTGKTSLTNHGVLIGKGVSAIAATGAGTAGQVLTSFGPTGDPAFANPATGGVWQFVDYKDFSTNVTSSFTQLCSFTGLDGDTDWMYMVKFFSKTNALTTRLVMRLNNDNSNNYYFKSIYSDVGSTGSPSTSNGVISDGYYIIGGISTGTTTSSCFGEVIVKAKRSATTPDLTTDRYAYSFAYSQNSSGYPGMAWNSGAYNETSTNITSLQLYGGEATNSTWEGRAILYKIKMS